MRGRWAGVWRASGAICPSRCWSLPRFASSFLWPGTGGVARQRHLVLAVFCATIYAIAPVVGFGWLLLVMGVAQCEPERTAVRTVYLGLFFVLLVYQALPWTALLAD